MALHNLVPSMFMSTPEKYAEPKDLRAAEVSQLLPVVLELVEERVGLFAKPGHHVHVVNIDKFETVLRYSLQAMNLFEDHVRSEKFFWDKDTLDHLHKVMLNFQGAYLQLADMAISAGKLWFAYERSLL